MNELRGCKEWATGGTRVRVRAKMSVVGTSSRKNVAGDGERGLCVA
jgi:hypothetical protein